MNTTTFWAMGGYGTYVWAAYAVTALGLAIMVWQVYAARRRTLCDLRMRYFI